MIKDWHKHPLNVNTIYIYHSRYGEAAYTSPFVLIGKDVRIDIKEIRHAMLDQAIDHAEGKVIESMHASPLNPSPITPSCKSFVLSFTCVIVFADITLLREI